MLTASICHLLPKAEDVKHDVVHVQAPRWGAAGFSQCECGWRFENAASIGSAYRELVKHIEGADVC
jgi:hypothetical protein